MYGTGQTGNANSEILSNISKKGVALGQRPELVGGGLVSRWLMQ
jgi:hypothetical protein